MLKLKFYLDQFYLCFKQTSAFPQVKVILGLTPIVAMHSISLSTKFSFVIKKFLN